MLSCINCKMQIPSRALICPYCRLDPGKWGQTFEPRTQSNFTSIGTLIAWIIILVLWSLIAGITIEDWISSFVKIFEMFISFIKSMFTFS